MAIKLIKLILRTAIIISLVIGGNLLFSGQQATAGEGEELDASKIERLEKGNPKLDSRLNQLASANTTKKISEFAKASGLEIINDEIRVIIECLPDQAEAATAVADDLGIVEASYKNLIQVVVPISQLTTLADTPGIRLVRMPLEPLPDVVSEGASLINADDWQTASFNGTGVKIGILDGGFTGYSSLLGTELPSSVTTQSFYAGSDIEGDTAHGTACAEIVYDIAPDADFYLVNFGTGVEMGNAVDWLIAQGVDIISCSVGYPIGGPGDGTGIFCEMVDDAYAAGILWSQAMGNQAQRHWQGNYIDTLADDFHEFDPGVDESNAISVINGETITVGLKWDDTWGSSGNDYDLLLYDSNSNLVKYSGWTQNGNDDPWEFLSYTANYTGIYHIAIYRWSATQAVNFHLYPYYHNLQYQVASSSLIVPADSGNAMSVGAVFWNSPATLESFSSRGPTEDSRTKPDLVAPDGVSTATYGASNGVAYLSGGTGFFGTSASAPHVAGAAALVKERYPSHTNDAIQTFLEGRAVELGESGKDNLFGSGRLDLGFPPETTPPTMEAIVEAEGQYYNTAPVLSNFGFDDNEALDDGWYQMDSYTGTWLTLFTDNGTTSWDSDNWTIPGFGALSDGSHTIYFKASDNASNVEGESGEWSWQFYKDTTPPTDPTGVSSTSHTVSTWSSDNTVDITWTDATDGGIGLDGYSILWSENSTSIPDQTKDIEEGVQTTTSSALVDSDSHYFHITSVDDLGNWQSTVHYGPFYIAVSCPILSDGTVSPVSGGTSANFTFSANYTDFENDAPSFIQISIDDGASENMTAKLGQDGDFTNGEIYEYWILGSDLGTGSHTYQFFANDETDDAIGDIDVHSGPTVTTPPKGGGGGGGGGAPPPGVTKIVDVTSSKGEFKEDVTCQSEDEYAELFITENTIAKLVSGGPIYVIRIFESEDPLPAPEQTALIGLVYDFSPEGITFDPAVDLIIKYEESQLPEGVNENNLIIATWDGNAGKWVELESIVDPENNTITTKIDHFSEFTILAYTRPATFTIGSFDISPESADIGEEVTISVLVTNIGDLTDSYEVTLKVDDMTIATKEVTIAGHSEQTVIFTTTLDEAGTYNVDVSGINGTFTVKALLIPAAFTASGLTISPADVEAGDSITIGALVTNNGDLTGDYEVTLMVNDEKIDAKTVTLAGGASQEVIFNITALDIAGTYWVSVNGLSDTFTVKELPVAPAQTNNWLLIVSIIVASVIVTGVFIGWYKLGLIRRLRLRPSPVMLNYVSDQREVEIPENQILQLQAESENSTKLAEANVSASFEGVGFNDYRIWLSGRLEKSKEIAATEIRVKFELEVQKECQAWLSEQWYKYQALLVNQLGVGKKSLTAKMRPLLEWQLRKDYQVWLSDKLEESNKIFVARMLTIFGCQVDNDYQAWISDRLEKGGRPIEAKAKTILECEVRKDYQVWLSDQLEKSKQSIEVRMIAMLDDYLRHVTSN